MDNNEYTIQVKFPWEDEPTEIKKSCELNLSSLSTTTSTSVPKSIDLTMTVDKDSSVYRMFIAWFDMVDKKRRRKYYGIYKPGHGYLQIHADHYGEQPFLFRTKSQANDCLDDLELLSLLKGAHVKPYWM